MPNYAYLIHFGMPPTQLRIRIPLRAASEVVTVEIVRRILLCLALALTGCGSSSAPDGGSCCRRCSSGKPCGDSCISRTATCNQGPGCACSAKVDDPIDDFEQSDASTTSGDEE